jgi:hypothetical protein
MASRMQRRLGRNFHLNSPTFHCYRTSNLPLVIRVVIPGIQRPFGGVPSGRPCALYLIWTRGGIVDREITVPNLLYCSNFSYYCPPTWSRGGWQSRWLPTEVRRRLFDPSNLPWVVSQCPFDPYRAGAKVYRAGGPPHRQPCWWCSKSGD